MTPGNPFYKCIPRDQPNQLIQGFLAHKKLTPPKDHHRSLGIGSWEKAVLCERGQPVLKLVPRTQEEPSLGDLLRDFEKDTEEDGGSGL